MKRFAAVCTACIWLALCLSFGLSGCAQRQDAALGADAIHSYRDIPLITQEEIDAIEGFRAAGARFSYGHTLETESFLLPDGSFAGYTIELCALLTELFGIEFVPRYCEDWETLIGGVNGLTIDFTGELTPTEEREKQYAMTAPLGGRDLSIYTNKNAPEIKTDAALSGLRVGFVGGTATKELIMRPFAGLEVHSVDVRSIAHAAQLLQTGEIDAFIIDTAIDPQFDVYDFIRSQKLFWPVFTQTSIATGNPALAPIISVIDKYLDAGGLQKINALYEEGDLAYKQNKLRASLTAEEIAYLEALDARGGVVPVSLEYDNYPFSFYNTKEEQFEGVSVDALAEVSRLTGIQFENTATPTTAWSSILADLESGRVSLVSHLVYSEERAKSYIWSTVPYSINYYALITRESFPPIRSYEVSLLRTGAFKDSIYEHIYRDWFPESDNLFLYESASDSFEALEKGEIDCVLGADFMILAQTNYREKSGYVVNCRFDSSLESAFGFNRQETVLRSIVDKALSHINLEPISSYWNSRVFDYSTEMERQKLMYLYASAAFLLFALAAMSFLSFRNKRLAQSLRSRTVTLSDARQSLQTILDTVPLPISILDRETHGFVYGNDVFLDLMELSSPEELYTLSGADTLAPAQDGALDLDKLWAGSENLNTKEVRLISSQNKTTDVRMHIRWCDYNGRECAIAIMVDLTAEKEYRQILLAAAEHEKEANRAKSLFLANMSHEIRTPMNGIIGLTDLLLSENISGRQLQYVKDIKTSSMALLDIINDILDLSKVSAGKLKIVPIDTDLSVILNNIVSMIGFSARVKGLRFLEDIRINSPEYVRLDDVRVRQIVINLLSNAIKFTKEGYVKLSAWLEEGMIHFEVRDTGIGIRPENLANIFGAFEQVDTLKNREIKGTGLGLSITKSLAELMGGHIRVESEYGTGSTFTVSIPHIPGDPANMERYDAEFVYLSAPKARVLVVDDIQINLTVGAGMLRLCGITATVAASGAEAIELVKQQDFDLVFMDHMMPEMDGVEATKHIRALGGKYRRLPIIALTANAMNESKDLLLHSGMDDFISKPIDKGEFMAILSKWLPADKIEADGRPAGAVQPEAYSGTLDAAARIDGLNIEQALSRIGGLQDVLETSLRQASNAIGGKLKNMDNYLSGDDLAGFALEAHGLKGMLANVGATYNSELAAQLELAAKAGEARLCAEKFSAFVSEVENLSEALKAIFTKADEAEKPLGHQEFLALKIAEAIDYLEGFEAFEAIACLQELDKYSFGDETTETLRDIKSMIEAFKYDDAILALTRYTH